MKNQQPLRESVTARGASASLLASLVILLLLLPFAERIPQPRIALDIAVTLIVLVAAVAIWRRDLLRAPVVGLAVMLIPITWVSLFIESRGLFVVSCFVSSGFLCVAAGAVLVLSIRHRFACVDSILGAFCAYLLFGFAWAYTYWAIDVASPGSFIWPEGQHDGHSAVGSITMFSGLIYYSMVTMSTLGFGDITPVGTVARTLSWMQSVTGQFYVAVVIAWLVGALPRNNQ